MKRWFQNLGEKMQRWMYGRYGYDELSKFLTICAFVLILLSDVSPIFNTLALIMLIWSMFRIYSRNTAKRQGERQKYLQIKTKIKQFFLRHRNMFRERKTHIYFKCPSCKIYLRVPKGKGTIEITCPKCKNKVTKKT